MAKNGRNNNSGNGKLDKIARDIVDIKYAIKMFVDEAAEDRKQAAEDRKQAAEDRKQAAEDRKDIKLYFVKILDEIHMDRLEARRDRRMIASILRGFSGKQDKMIDMQKEMISMQKEMIKLQKHGNSKLGSIEQLLKVRSNGGPNGRKKS